MKKLNKFKKLIAFTLAEVLVTLGIIGVVSALTLPSLTANTKNRTNVTHLHKVYSDVTQAFRMVIVDSNADNLLESNLSQLGPAGFLRRYMSFARLCEGKDASSCLASSYTNMKRVAYDASQSLSDTSACAVLNSNSTVCITNNKGSYEILTDVNGLAQPNVLGRDLFTFTMNEDGTIHTEDSNQNLLALCQSQTSADTYGYCLSRIIFDGWRMDY